MTVQARDVPRRRPADRRAQILAAAARRFRRDGYHRVAMADIAADVGIRASALYRHVRGKEELLLTVLDGQLARMEEVAAGSADPIAALAAHAVELREFGALWGREAGHLPPDARRAVRHRLRGVAASLAGDVADEDDLRSWAVLSVLDSPAHHGVQVDADRLSAVLLAAARAVAVAPLPDDRDVLPPEDGGLPPASRREALLGVAARLFADRGYPSVGLDDIGAAAGIAGPSVYNHFASKADVLASVLQRGNEALWFTLHHDLARASDPADALRRLAARYSAFVADDPAIVGVLLTEVVHLPADVREPFRRAQRDYVAEWVALLRRDRPDRDETDALLRVHAALSVVNSLSRIHHLRTRPGHVARTATLARSALELS
ncbi:TetR/AcrR family transcriptional regulator [Pseudonocardia endophytica]|uniref:TetR family transcriptional regulator n=1 Tax=Pseudonocardia endophytica TaxID=401976 RepID=A0A4R1I0T7_PSEEN|nr:TetR/AcrR family transcriptional regulator [Pseudonocardia endophytica]TCK26830.1 TetR family transcriptional regulator [Pseudonocardia endophytica]